MQVQYSTLPTISTGSAPKVSPAAKIASRLPPLAPMSATAMMSKPPIRMTDIGRLISASTRAPNIEITTMAQANTIVATV